jgi:hypothetical protein
VSGEPARDGAPDASEPLEALVERAFDYRGDVTVVTIDGEELVGFLANRNGDVQDPFVQLLESGRPDPRTLRYAEIRTIRFTGNDPAAGNRHATWLGRRAEVDRSAGGPSGA